MEGVENREVLCPWCGETFLAPDELVHVVATGTGREGDDLDFRALTSEEWWGLPATEQMFWMSRDNTYIEVCPNSSSLELVPRYFPDRSPQADAIPPEPDPGDDLTIEMAPPALEHESGPSGTGPEPAGGDPSAPDDAFGRRDGLEAMPFVMPNELEGFHQLPIGYGKHPVVVIALAGASEAGKSTLLGSIMYQLESDQSTNDRYSEMGFELRLALDRFGTMDGEGEGVAQFVDAPHWAPLATRGGSGRLVFIRSTVRIPSNNVRRESPGTAQVIQAVRRRSGPTANQGDEVKIDVLLVDLPGEAFESPGALYKWSPIVIHADALLVVQDISEGRAANRDVNGITAGSTPMTAAKVIRVIQAAEERLSWKSADKRIPVALAVTKVDQLQPMLSRPGLANSVHAERIMGRAQFRLEEAHIRDATRGSFAVLSAWDSNKAATDLIRNFDPVSVHLVSATGSEPETRVRQETEGPKERACFPGLAPRNVLDPLVTLVWRWALAQR